MVWPSPMVVAKEIRMSVKDAAIPMVVEWFKLNILVLLGEGEVVWCFAIRDFLR